ncbi:MAG: methyltransferase domain-containing protein [Fibrobacterales bacterium]
MQSKDTIFDGKAEKFRRNIYDSNKGYIRQYILWNDMQTNLLLLSKTKSSKAPILDAGGGFGRTALRCAERGFSIDLVEPSQDMLTLAKEECSAVSHGSRITPIHSTIQEYTATYSGPQYPMILFHAVLEWLEQPKETLSELLTLLAPGGQLSLMFYNRNSAIMKTVLKGNFYRDDGSFQFGKSKSFTPGNPLDQNEVYSWLTEWGYTIESKCGIRIFNDYLHAPVSHEDLDTFCAVEEDFCRKEPFASLGRYIHIVCTKPEL